MHMARQAEMSMDDVVWKQNAAVFRRCTKRQEPIRAFGCVGYLADARGCMLDGSRCPGNMGSVELTASCQLLQL